jgi:hypothetical protein
LRIIRIIFTRCGGVCRATRTAAAAGVFLFKISQKFSDEKRCRYGNDDDDNNGLHG